MREIASFIRLEVLCHLLRRNRHGNVLLGELFDAFPIACKIPPTACAIIRRSSMSFAIGLAGCSAATARQASTLSFTTFRSGGDIGKRIGLERAVAMR